MTIIATCCVPSYSLAPPPAPCFSWPALMVLEQEATTMD